MAAIIIDRDREEVVDLVKEYGGDKFNESRGQIETLRTELSNTRSIVARLVNALADKRIFTDEELIVLIRGY